MTDSVIEYDIGVIEDGSQIILKKGKVLKLFQIRKNRPVWVDKAKFSLAGAVGHRYGSTFEVKNGEMVKIEAVSMTTTSLDLSSGQDNRELKDTVENQKLSRDDIEELKGQGIRGQNLVEHIIENSATFKNKTEFSQQKYIKKKKQKHLQVYTVLRPCTRLLFEMYYNRGPSKVSYMRLDTVSQILNQCNVHAHSKIMVLEMCQGILLGSVMERMAGTGKLVQLFHGTAPPRQALEGFSFPNDFYNNLYCFPLDKVNTLCHASNVKKDNEITETNKQESSPMVTDDVEETQLECSKSTEEKAVVSKNIVAVPDPTNGNEVDETSAKKPKLDEELTTSKEKERINRKEQRRTKMLQAREILETGKMDGLIVASKLHPTSIVMALIEYMDLSRPIVVYCPFKEPLVDLYMKLRTRGGVINLRLTETWYREQQVLPQRTHPMITMSGTGGFLLTGLVVGC